jgi:hypothetical protein
MRPKTRRKRREPDRFSIHAKLPPRFLAKHFKGSSEKPLPTGTIRGWALAGAFGPRAKQAAQRKERILYAWNEIIGATGAWSPSGDISAMQRAPYDVVQIAEILGCSTEEARARLRGRKVPGAFKMGHFWYARAAELDTAQPHL